MQQHFVLSAKEFPNEELGFLDDSLSKGGALPVKAFKGVGPFRSFPGVKKI